MENYIISLKDPSGNVGGPKANMDNIKFLKEQMGFKELWLDYGWKDGFWWHHNLWDWINTRIHKYQLSRSVLPKFFKEHPDIDNVVIQYPLYSNKLIKQITDSVHQNSHAKLYFIIHDAEMIRLYADEPKRAQGELDSFNLSDGIIGHNAKMNKFLKEQGVKVPLVDLGIFDYDNPQPLQEYKGYDKSVCYAGNLIDAEFLQDVHPTNRFDLFGPNPAESYNEGLNYKGQFSPTDLPAHMDENFGLVWHGTSVDTCDGVFGRYLKWNNPHKTSLCLSSGLPVIIWDQAALADFVLENGVGITISSLNDLNDKLDALTEEEYRQMHDNVQKVANQMRTGYYITHAMEKMINN